MLLAKKVDCIVLIIKKMGWLMSKIRKHVKANGVQQEFNKNTTATVYFVT